MDFIQLAYFQVAAREEHFTKAAEKIGISQPALSLVMNRLEKEIGLKLFDHIGRNIILNENGKLLLKSSDIILHEYNKVMKQFEDLRCVDENTLHIAVTGINFADSIIKEFAKRFPCVNITQTLIDINEISQVLGNNDVDYVIGTGNQQFDGVDLQTLWKEKIFMAVPECHRLAHKKTIVLSDFSGDKFICVPQNFSYRRFTDKLLEDAKIFPSTIIECFPGHIAPLIRDTLSVAIIPDALIQNSEPETYHGIVLLPLQDTFRTIVLYQKKKKSLRSVEKKFERYIKQNYKVSEGVGNAFKDDLKMRK